ncbi:uncharacterized protein LOC123006609 [Tribolium madens]|uniref:uncharacterized protein LOC123006609 n=1 Tax=Tribolium madens TaxID=41895 RepID=UPI001CF7632D|nr:uncharacterized protein LOC123006609 [Tribolium madens]
MAFQVAPKIILFAMLSLAASSSVIQQRDAEWEAMLNDILTKDLDLDNASARNISENLLVTLISSLLYIYLILTVYYLMLLDNEDRLARVISWFAKFMIVLTVAVYIFSKYFLPKRDMFESINRLAVCLFTLSTLQIVHLGVCLYRSYFSFPNIPGIIKKYWKKLLVLLGKRTPPPPPQNILELEDTAV